MTARPAADSSALCERCGGVATKLDAVAVALQPLRSFAATAVLDWPLSYRLAGLRRSAALQ